MANQPMLCLCSELWKWVFSVCLVTSQVLAVAVPVDWRGRLDRNIYELYRGRPKCSLVEMRSRQYLFQGDMILSQDLLDGGATFTGRLVADQYWPSQSNLVYVPYVISSAFDDSQADLIRQAMASLSDKVSSCIRFGPRTHQDDYIEIVLAPISTLCSSIIGRIGGRQVLNLGLDCLKDGIIQHELLHALGIFHEQSRPDRDEHVVIFEDNIFPGRLNNFQILPEMATYDVPYDLDSIMHYAWNDLSVDSDLPTILPRDASAKARMGQRDALTPYDVAKVMRAYLCNVSTSPSLTTVRPSPVPSSDLPVFDLGPITPDQCSQLDTVNCDVSQGSNQCIDSILHVSCGLAASNTEIELVFARLSKLTATRPLSVEIQGKRSLTPALFAPVRQMIIELTIGYFSGISSHNLPWLDLPNLLGFGFWQCNNIKLDGDMVGGYSRLKALEFGKSTVAVLDRQIFDRLPQLELLALDHGLQAPFTNLQLRHLHRFHCSCEYRWLRDLLHQKPLLIQPKVWAQLHRYGNRGSIPYPEESIFRSVDCAKTGAAMVLSVTDVFSINQQC